MSKLSCAVVFIVKHRLKQSARYDTIFGRMLWMGMRIIYWISLQARAVRGITFWNSAQGCTGVLGSSCAQAAGQSEGEQPAEMLVIS